LTVTEPASFINIDMELESASDLNELAEHWKGKVFVLNTGPTEDGFHLALEPLIDGGLNRDPVECANHLLGLVAALPPELINIWNKCTSRVFDFGFDGGLESSPIHTTLDSKIMLQMAQLRIDFRITVYPFRA
jgi:hypothetical protein